MKLLSTLCLIFLIQYSHGSSVDVEASPTKAEVFSTLCSSEVHGTMLPDPFDCSSFVVCDHGETSIFHCDYGLRYDARLKVCNWAQNVMCGESPNIPPDHNSQVRCFGYDSVYFIPHSTDCEQYYICANGIPYLHHCAPGIHWDIVHNHCDRPQNAVCYDKNDANNNETSTWPDPEVTTGKHEEPMPDCDGEQKFFPYPEDCSKYYICISGAPFIMSCPTSYIWNDNRLQCDQPGPDTTEHCQAKTK